MPFGSILLNDGNKIPQIAFGTGSVWKGKDVVEYVEQALECGFNHIDTAAIYRTEEGVGQAIRESGLKREQLYITTKYDGGDVRQAIELSLKKLGVSYVDMYLIHAPQLVDGRDIVGTWKEFEKIKADGFAKSIGVSNFTIKDLQDLFNATKIVPAVNQISLNPYNYAQNIQLLEFCARNGIVVEAYSSLAPLTKTPGGPVDKPIQRAADRLGATPSQVIFSWVASKGAVIVTTSSKRFRLKEYLEVADLPLLTTEEITEIEAAGAKGPSFLSRGVLLRRAVPLVALATVYFCMRAFVAGVYMSPSS